MTQDNFPGTPNAVDETISIERRRHRLATALDSLTVDELRRLIAEIECEIATASINNALQLRGRRRLENTERL